MLHTSLLASKERGTRTRSSRFFTHTLFCSALALLSPALAYGQSTSTPLPLDIDPTLSRIDEEALRTEIHRELRLSTLTEGSKLGTLLVRNEGEQVAVVFVTNDGRVISRKVDLPEDQGVAARTLAFAASNLVRDEASEILASLQTPTPVPEPLPAPTPEPEPEIAPALHPCRTGKQIPVGIDFAPFVGTSTAAPDATRGFSFNLIGGYSKGLNGFEIGGVVNIESSHMCGVQIAGVGNIVGGPVHGLQLAIVNAGGPVRGAQVGVVDVSSGDVSGAQIGVVSVAGGSVKGAQLGVVNVTGGDIRGAQIGVANIAGGSSVGSQIAVVNVAGEDAERLQMGVVNGAGASMRGAQIGVANVVGEDVGTQIGVANVAPGKVGGLQLGVFNYADESDVSIGLLSIVRRGRTSLEAWGTADGTASVGVRHGGRVVHNIFGVGHPFGTEDSSFALTVGLGARVPLADRLHLDIDGTITTHSSKPFFDNPPQVSRLGFNFGYEVADRFGIFGGPSVDVIVSRDSSPFPEPVWGSTSLKDGKHRVAIAPGATLGLRFDVQKSR